MNQTGVIVIAVALAAAVVYIIYTRKENYWPQTQNVHVDQYRQAPEPDYGLDKIPYEKTESNAVVADGFNPTERLQTITRDRLIYANKSSKLRRMGDPFRGDIPIIPPVGNWFIPPVKPSTDLQHGALTIMGGIGNES